MDIRLDLVCQQCEFENSVGAILCQKCGHVLGKETRHASYGRLPGVPARDEPRSEVEAPVRGKCKACGYKNDIDAVSCSMCGELLPPTFD